jgi:hypothetical protein
MKRSLLTLAVGLFGPALSAFAVPVPATPDPLGQPPAELARAFEARRGQVIADALTRIDPANTEAGGLLAVAVAYAQGEHLDWARARLAFHTEKPAGAMFWMYPMVLLMKAGAEHLTADDWALIRQSWVDYFPYRGDTENHWLMYYGSLFLAAETWPDLGPEGWYNGKSSAENRAEAKAWILEWMRITTSYGQGEYDSPNYINPFLNPLAMLAAWAHDADLRHRAQMMMTYIIADYAAEQIGGNYGGAYSRVYPRPAMQPALVSSSAYGWYLFGLGDFFPDGGVQLLALSGYQPPPILHRIAHDRREAHEHRELKRTRWRMRHAGPDAFEVAGLLTQPVYKTSYLTADYILGSSQGGLLQPIQHRTWSLVWHEANPTGVANTFFALHPYHSPLEGTMYFAADWDLVTDLIARSKVDYNSADKLVGGSPYEQVFQHRAALIGLYDIPAGTDFPFLTAFFSKDTAERVECDSGWIFTRGGPTYIAYRPLAPGQWKAANWTGLLAGGAGAWISSGFENWGTGHDAYVSEHPRNGYVVQVASAHEFDSYAAFQAAVRALPLEFSLDGAKPRVTFTTLDGTRLEAAYDAPLVINGTPQSREGWPLFDGPFLSAERESQTLTLSHGSETLHLDFKRNRAVTTLD